jgi:hypothetical protein
MPEHDVRQCPPFRWGKARLEAAQLLAEDELTDLEIAARAGVSDRQLRRWKQAPAFRARVEALARALGDAAARHAIGHKARRVRVQQDRWERLLRIVAERGADPDMQGVPGGGTGFLVRRTKAVGTGPAARVVDEYEFDAALAKALAEVERQAAQELGQLAMKHEHAGPGGGPVPITVIEVVKPTEVAHGGRLD